MYHERYHAITIIFESHSTSADNEVDLASGWFDSPLSETGKKQAAELGVRYENKKIDAVFCSDLQRSFMTAQLAFNDKYPIIQDQRLRECNFGDLERERKVTLEEQKIIHLDTAYPNGESYRDVSRRVALFLDDLLKYYDGQTLLIIGHRATQYALEQWLTKKTLEEAVLAPWKWQPGWTYTLE